MTDIENRVTILETSLLTVANTIYAMIQNNMSTEVPTPAPRLPFEREEPALLPMRTAGHFGLDPQQRAHWADVYSRMVSAGLLRGGEVTSGNFTWLMCGVGTAPRGAVRWYGSTRELAYVVRRYLNARWEVALAWFKDKKDSELPKSFKNTKAPSGENMRKMDSVFRTKD